MSAAPIHHKWQEIADLPADLEQFRDPELDSLHRVWLDQKATIDEKAFAAELAREWSIETGIIEGVYTLDRGVTRTLIDRGIDSSYIPHDSTNRDPELVARIIRAHRDALEGLFTFVAGGRELSTGYIKELHAAMLQYQETTTVFDQFGTRMEIQLEKGTYKRHNNNPTRDDGSVHEYCPWEHVASEMDRLIELHQQHERRDVMVLVEASWLHHTFTQIHPFQDGNGRVARALASLVLIKGGFFPLVVSRDDREKYIDALEAADEGDLTSLVGLFAGLQKRDLTKAIIHAANTKPVGSVDEAVEVTRGLLADLGKLPKGPRAEVERRAGHLRDLAQARLSEAANKLERGFDLGTSTVRFLALPEAGFSAAGIRSLSLTLAAERMASNLLVAFDVDGASRGLALVTAKLEGRDGQLISPLSDDDFRVDYLEPIDELQSRFTKWLDDVIYRGLCGVAEDTV